MRNIPPDLDKKEIDIKLFSQVPYKQLIKYNVIPIEENDFNVIIVFEDPLDMEAQDVMQRLFPKKPIKIAISKPKLIHKHLQAIEINENVKKFNNIGEYLKFLENLV